MPTQPKHETAENGDCKPMCPACHNLCPACDCPLSARGAACQDCPPAEPLALKAVRSPVGERETLGDKILGMYSRGTLGVAALRELQEYLAENPVARAMEEERESLGVFRPEEAPRESAENGTCGACGGPLPSSRDAICEECEPESTWQGMANTASAVAERREPSVNGALLLFRSLFGERKAVSIAWDGSRVVVAEHSPFMEAPPEEKATPGGLATAARSAAAELRHAYRPDVRDWEIVAGVIRALERATTEPPESMVTTHRCAAPGCHAHAVGMDGLPPETVAALTKGDWTWDGARLWCDVHRPASTEPHEESQPEVAPPTKEEARAELAEWGIDEAAFLARARATVERVRAAQDAATPPVQGAPDAIDVVEDVYVTAANALDGERAGHLAGLRAVAAHVRGLAPAPSALLTPEDVAHVQDRFDRGETMTPSEQRAVLLQTAAQGRRIAELERDCDALSETALVSEQRSIAALEELARMTEERDEARAQLTAVRAELDAKTGYMTRVAEQISASLTRVAGAFGPGPLHDTLMEAVEDTRRTLAAVSAPPAPPPPTPEVARRKEMPTLHLYRETGEGRLYAARNVLHAEELWKADTGKDPVHHAAFVKISDEEGVTISDNEEAVTLPARAWALGYGPGRVGGRND